MKIYLSLLLMFSTLLVGCAGTIPPSGDINDQPVLPQGKPTNAPSTTAAKMISPLTSW